MHEFALADAVLRAALESAGREGLSRITRILVRVGELQQIKKDVFEYAMKEVRPVDDPRLEALEVLVEVEPASFRCRACEHEFTLAAAAGERGDDESEAIHFVPELAHAFMACPACQSPDFEFLRGREIEIVEIEGERDDA
jgi:hydrogenase nickel incorporation protein HypA/HybF